MCVRFGVWAGGGGGEVVVVVRALGTNHYAFKIDGTKCRCKVQDYYFGII